MALPKERDLFARAVLAPVGEQATLLGDDAMVDGFLAMQGNNYDRELMVVGRAVNGWGSGIDARSLADQSEAARFANEVFDGVNDSVPRPMMWVTDLWQISKRDQYNTARSAFWRVIRRVTGELGIADIDGASWPSHLVWSNLYKVSAHSAGNPSAALCRMQLSGCLDLLELELSIYRPRRLLFLTGQDWAEPFLERIAFRPVSSGGTGLVKAVGTVVVPGSDETTHVVVAAHPQGKSEDAWVAEVMAAFTQ